MRKEVLKEADSPAFNGSLERIRFDGFSIGDGLKEGVLYGEGKNCAIDGTNGVGALRAGIGLTARKEFSVYPVPYMDDPLYKLVDFRFNRGGWSFGRMMVAVTENGKVYDISTGEAVLLRDFGQRTEFFPVLDTVEGYTYYVFYNSLGTWRFDFAGKFNVLEVPEGVQCGCNFAERSFLAVKPFGIRFSRVMAPLDFTEDEKDGGWLHLPDDKGDSVAFETVNGKLYLFREKGIYELEVADSATNFSVREVAYGGKRIFRGGVKRVGDKILFLTEGGLRCLDKQGVKRLCEGFDFAPLVGEGQDCRCAEADGVYLLQYVKKNGAVRSVAVLPENGCAYESFEKLGLCDVGEETIFTVGGWPYCLIADGEMPAWEERSFTVRKNFGGEYTLKRITFEGKGEVTVSVSNGRASRVAELDLSYGRRTIDVAIKGDGSDGGVTIELRLKKGAVVRAAVAEVYRLKGGR